MNRNLHRCFCVPRFHRTLDEAFRTPRYASALERPQPSVWRRLLDAIKELVA